jgi:hypothetical protein
MRGVQEDLLPGQGDWRSGNPPMLAGLWRSAEVMETVARVEVGVARTLQALSMRGGSEAAARRLMLAREAIAGANTVIDRSKHLQREACRWTARSGDPAALRQVLDRAARVLEDLAAAQVDIAGVLRGAAEQEPGLAGRRWQMAHDASAGARRAAAQARILRDLAGTSGAGPPADGNLLPGSQGGSTDGCP